MGKLVLTSGGYLDGQRGKECDEIIEILSKHKKVLLIDNATLTGSNTSGIPILIRNFQKIANSITRLSLNKDNLNSIFGYDVLYITGGDLAPLIQLSQDTELHSTLTNFIKDGGAIIGESAGAMIFGNDLKWIYEIKKGTKAKYNINLPSYKGLGIVDINFFPHWNKTTVEMQEKVSKYEEENNLSITRVKDNDFLIYEL